MSKEDSGAKILEYLHRFRENFVSGEQIALKLGITRSAVWKKVQELRRGGCDILAVPRRGYLLRAEPDRLHPAHLAARGIYPVRSLPSDITFPPKEGKNQAAASSPSSKKERGRGTVSSLSPAGGQDQGERGGSGGSPPVYFEEAVDSTNDAARRLAESGAAEAVIIAEQQHHGRGRRGRSWESPPGKGLWFSILLRPRGLSPAEASPITLVTAVALARGLRAASGLAVSVKWPNDLLVEGRKVGGILTEIRGEPDFIEYLVVGAGINVNHSEEDFPADLRQRACSLAIAAGRRFDRADLFQALLGELNQSYRRFFREGFASFRQEWIELSVSLGKAVTVAWPGGKLQGEAMDIDQTGALLLKDTAGKLHRINYGEIL